MDAREGPVDTASAEEPKDQQVTSHGDELELALANMTVEGASMCSCGVCFVNKQTTHVNVVSTETKLVQVSRLCEADRGKTIASEQRESRGGGGGGCVSNLC